MAPDPHTKLLAQCRVQLLPSTVQTPQPEIVIGSLPRRELVWEQPPGAATPYHVEDGIQDLAARMQSRSAKTLGRRQERVQASKLSVREVGQVGSPQSQTPAILPAKTTHVPVFRQSLGRVRRATTRRSFKPKASVAGSRTSIAARRSSRRFTARSRTVSGGGEGGCVGVRHRLAPAGGASTGYCCSSVRAGRQEVQVWERQVCVPCPTWLHQYGCPYTEAATGASVRAFSRECSVTPDETVDLRRGWSARGRGRNRTTFGGSGSGSSNSGHWRCRSNSRVNSSWSCKRRHRTARATSG